MYTVDLVVTAVNLFAVRSCAGESLPQAAITPNGLAFDRQWRLVSPEGKFLTQRECPKMALLKPTVVDGQLQIRFGNSSACAPNCFDNPGADLVSISAGCMGIDQGDDIANWLGERLGIAARLLRVVNSQGLESGTAASHQAHSDFARPDMSPVLVISEESLADLNTRLDQPVPMNRFRPNIVVRGGKPYEEESWSRVVIGDVVYVASTEPCGRCSMINIDQASGEKAGREPLKTLASYRRTPGAVIFGKYMVPQSCGLVRVGDKITLIAD